MTRLGTDSGAADFPHSAHATDPAVAKVFVEIRGKKSISLIVRTPWRVLEVESCALSKFEPPTTLGDPKNVEKTIQKNFDFLGVRKFLFGAFFQNFTQAWAPILRWEMDLGLNNFSTNYFGCSSKFA